jgi:repressor LexA
MLSNKELGQYLKNVREQLGYSTYDVNKLCDISQSYLSLMENGRRKASAIILKKLAPIYSLNYIDLYEKAGYIDLIDNSKKSKTKLDKLGNPVVEIPILGTVKAGYNYLAQENWIGTIDIDKKLADSGEFFALRVKGDSMAPVLIEDDIVIIKKQDDFENGDIVVAIVNGDEATIKKGKKSESKILLQPFNTNYDPLIFTEEEMDTIPVRIVGIVKQLKREF